MEAVKKIHALLKTVWKGSPLFGKDEGILKKTTYTDTGEIFYNAYIEWLDKNDVSTEVTLAVLGRSPREPGCSYTINLI
jgi:hypothetical protein